MKLNNMTIEQIESKLKSMDGWEYRKCLNIPYEKKLKELKISTTSGSSSGSNSGSSSVSDNWYTSTEQSVVITQTESVSVTDLNTLNSNTNDKPIDASRITSLASASISDINTLLTSANDTSQFTANSFQNLQTVMVNDIDVSINDLNSAINLATSVSGGTVFSLGSGVAITGGDESAFSNLLTIKMNGNISITDQNFTVSNGTLSVNNANLLNAATNGYITAAINTSSTIDELKTLTGSSNAYTIVINSVDASANASDLIAIETATTISVEASAITEISGSFSDIATLYGSSGITGLGDENLYILGDISVPQANTLDNLTTQYIIAAINTSSTIDELKTLTGSNNSYTIVINSVDTNANASDLIVIDSITNKSVDASNITLITGNYSDITTLYGSSGITGLGNENLNILGSLSVTQRNALELLTSGIIQSV